jgi:hypothetical protein
MTAALSAEARTAERTIFELLMPHDDATEATKPPAPPPTGIYALLFDLRDDVKDLPSSPNLVLALVGGSLAVAVSSRRRLPQCAPPKPL